ncbi:MAG: hypothetical protein ABJE95_29830 [Byssovorax sp.]
MRPVRPPSPPAACFAAVSLLVALALTAGCADPDPTTPVDATTLARLTSEGEAGLRALGKGRFEVVEYRAEETKRVDFADPFAFHTRLVALVFRARLRFLTRLHVPTQSDLDARIGAAGWTIEESYDGLTLHEVLGEGAHEAGSEASIQAAAMFVDLRPGLRFERIDHVR